jgi:hypothetical protein
MSGRESGYPVPDRYEYLVLYHQPQGTVPVWYTSVVDTVVESE